MSILDGKPVRMPPRASMPELTTLKALTVWQPWASMIVMGLKPLEWRGWPAPAWVQGKRIAIHAAKRITRRAEVDQILADLRVEKMGGMPTLLKVDETIDFLERLIANHCQGLPESAIVGTAVLGEPSLAKDLGRLQADSDRIDHTKWAWPMGEPEQWNPPAPATGAQGFWNWRGVIPA